MGSEMCIRDSPNPTPTAPCITEISNIIQTSILDNFLSLRFLTLPAGVGCICSTAAVSESEEIEPTLNRLKKVPWCRPMVYSLQYVSVFPAMPGSIYSPRIEDGVKIINLIPYLYFRMSSGALQESHSMKGSKSQPKWQKVLQQPETIEQKQTTARTFPAALID